MTFYVVVFDTGMKMGVDTHVLENMTKRKDPQGILHWLDHELTMTWLTIEKVALSPGQLKVTTR